MKNTRLVYSTDPKDNIVCPGCKELKSECQCPQEESMEGAKFTVIFRLEKKAEVAKLLLSLMASQKRVLPQRAM